MNIHTGNTEVLFAVDRIHTVASMAQLRLRRIPNHLIIFFRVLCTVAILHVCKAHMDSLTGILLEALMDVATDCLVGLVVRRPPREREIPGSNPAGAGIFSGSSHTSDSKIGTPVATLPGAWRYRVSAGTGRPGVSML